MGKDGEVMPMKVKMENRIHKIKSFAHFIFPSLNSLKI